MVVVGGKGKKSLAALIDRVAEASAGREIAADRIAEAHPDAAPQLLGGARFKVIEIEVGILIEPIGAVDAGGKGQPSVVQKAELTVAQVIGRGNVAHLAGGKVDTVEPVGQRLAVSIGRGDKGEPRVLRVECQAGNRCFISRYLRDGTALIVIEPSAAAVDDAFAVLPERKLGENVVVSLAGQLLFGLAAVSLVFSQRAIAVQALGGSEIKIVLRKKSHLAHRVRQAGNVALGAAVIAEAAQRRLREDARRLFLFILFFDI